MLRVGLDPGSPFYSVLVTAHQGLLVEYREEQGGDAALIDVPLNTKDYLPVYVKVTREGNDFNAHYSQDGVNWTKVPDVTKTMPLPTKLFAGLAMTSHGTLQLGTATLDTVYVGP
jgi:beta-xylosidase